MTTLSSGAASRAGGLILFILFLLVLVIIGVLFMAGMEYLGDFLDKPNIWPATVAMCILLMALGFVFLSFPFFIVGGGALFGLSWLKYG